MKYLFVEQLFNVVLDVDTSKEFVNLKKSQKTTYNISKAIQNIQMKIKKVNGYPIRTKATGKQNITRDGTYKQYFINTNHQQHTVLQVW